MSIAVNVNDPTNTGVNNTQSSTSSSSLTGSNASDLQSSFLTLLVAQLKNQDPTNPMQNNELTTQLAQISTVSGIEKLNTTLGSVSGQIRAGHRIRFAGSFRLHALAGESYRLCQSWVTIFWIQFIRIVFLQVQQIRTIQRLAVS